MPILFAFEHAPVRFKLRACVSEHAVNRKLRTIPRGLSHHGMCRVVWEGGTWLFLKRWGGLSEMVVIARHSRAAPPSQWRRGSGEN
jgi:hypothetical protein